jgi:hypothetical protein
VAERLELDITKVAPPIEALLQAGVIPCEHPDNAEALGVDGAKILLAIGSQQARPASIVRVSERLAAMTLQIEISGQASVGAARTLPRSKSSSFETDLTLISRSLWKAAHGPSPSRIHPVAVSILWNDERGSCLFGTIDQWERGRTRRKKIYSSESLGLPAAIVGNWDAFQLPAVGGTVFSPLPLLGLCDLLDEGVGDTPASLR